MRPAWGRFGGRKHTANLGANVWTACHSGRLKGTESPDPGSCSKFVFMDQPAQHIPPLDKQAI
jgi:hypothetical protein